MDCFFKKSYSPMAFHLTSNVVLHHVCCLLSIQLSLILWPLKSTFSKNQIICVHEVECWLYLCLIRFFCVLARCYLAIFPAIVKCPFEGKGNYNFSVVVFMMEFPCLCVFVPATLLFPVFSSAN